MKSSGWFLGFIKMDESLDNFIVEGLLNGTIKRCPGCGILTEKISGCNYLKCICGIEWCWLCNSIKYQVCNNLEHNSH